MRRLSMKSKRTKSETSGSETEENGDDIDNGNDEATGIITKNNNDASSSESAADASPATRKTPMKRRSRGATQKSAAHADDGAEVAVEAMESEQRENGEKAIMKPSPNKRKKKEVQKASTSASDKNAVDDDEYEVEKIVGHRTIKGRRQFLVRWKGYNESSDSWENEKDLNCPNLIEDFLINEQEIKMAAKDNKETKTAKTKPGKVDKSKKSNAKKQAEDGKADGKNKDNSKEFEVEKIIEVHFKKKGSREFLIRWKGFSAADDTWEPEENLNCPDLIAKFMRKLEKVKTVDIRELRTNPAHTKRYTLTTHDSGRRLSRRHLDKQRATYHECDE